MNRMAVVRVPLAVVSLLLVGAPLAAFEKPSPPAGTVQGLLAKPARLEVKDVTLAEALVALRVAADVNIVFSPSLLPQGKRVSCNCSSATYCCFPAADRGMVRSNCSIQRPCPSVRSTTRLRRSSATRF